MRNFQEFESNRVAVIFRDKKERNEFLKLCDEKGLKWCGKGESATSYNVPDYVKVIYCHYGNMQHNGILGDIRCGYEIVPASEFLQPQATIEIFQSKQTVVCLKKENGKVIARGVAKCSKDDVFNFDYGAELALNRMLANSKNKEFSKTIHEVGKKIAASFLAASAGISSVNSAIKAASEEQQRTMKESLTKLNHIQGDAVDAVLPIIKTLKDGTKIIKQDSYEVGDVILFKKDLIPVGCLRTATITETSDVCLFRFGGIGWYSINRIKGKVIE
jgi:hypothetical protein